MPRKEATATNSDHQGNLTYHRINEILESYQEQQIPFSFYRSAKSIWMVAHVDSGKPRIMTWTPEDTSDMYNAASRLALQGIQVGISFQHPLFGRID